MGVKRLKSEVDENPPKIDGEMLKWAIRFHGHLGPFLILGLRAGLRAVELFGRDPFKLKAIVALRRIIPYTCFLDGIQLSTGCTLGKGNLEVLEGDGIMVRFIHENGELMLIVRDEILKEAISAEDVEKEALKLLNLPLDKLFMERH